MGVLVLGVNVEGIPFKITLLLRLKSFVVDPLWCGAALVMTTSLILWCLDKLWQNKVTFIDNILQPIVYPHFGAHQAVRPIFQDNNARLQRACVVTDSLT